MTFDDALTLIKDFNTPYIKINDTNGKRLFEIEDTVGSEATINKLKDYEPILRTQGRVIFKAANETQKKQNYRDAFEWSVTFAGVPVQANANTQIAGPLPAGYISSEHALLLAQVQSLTKQMEFDKKFMELENKINSKPKQFDPEKYIPALGMFMDVDETKLNNMVKIAQVMAMMNGQAMPAQAKAGINGLQEKAVIKGTEEEIKLATEIDNNLEKLSEKIPIQKINELIKLLIEKPQCADIALNFAPTQ